VTSLLNYSDIAKIFEEIELRLVSSLKRNLSRHKKWERDEGFEWSAWQAEKLRNMENFRRRNANIMAEYTDVIDGETRRLMADQFDEGQRLAERSAPGNDGFTSVPDKHFFGVNEQKMQSLMTDITTLEKYVETAALRMTDDVYRQTVNRVQLAMGTGSMTLEQAVDMATRDFLDKGINCIVYADGRRVNIADYVRMALRTTSTRATLQGQAKRWAELGYDTVMTSQYGMCSKTCEPWQGRVYIDDVYTQWDGDVEERNGELWGKSNYCGKWFCLLSTAIWGHLFHPNCRHTLTQYIDGVTEIPEPIPAETIRKQREYEQKQRAMERKIRKLKRFAEGTLDPDTAKEYSGKLKAVQKELREFIAKTNADEGKTVLRRDYSREKVYGNVDLTNERNKSILKEKISQGEITLSLNPEKQNPHIYGSDEYNPANNKSYFNISAEELQEIVNNNYASGEVKIKPNGQIKEIISADKDIGVVLDEQGNVIMTSNSFTVHYSKKRTHAVPTKRRNKDET
jgi:hypothetical protein